MNPPAANLTRVAQREPHRVDGQPHARTRERASASGSGGHAAFIQNQPSGNPGSQSDSSPGLPEGPANHAQGPPSPIIVRSNRRHGRFAALLGGVLATALLTFAPSANATYDPLGGGITKLTLDKGFVRLLAAHGVELTATAPAKRSGHVYTMPVSGGALDPAEQKGEIDQEGALVFERGAHRVPLREIVVKTKPEPLIAKVGGGQLKLAAAKKRSFSRAGFGSSFTASDLRLSAKLATRLAKKLRLHGVFEAGQRLGALRSTAQPATVAILPVGRATLTPDPAFIVKLDSLFVSLNPISPGERQPGPLFTFPFVGSGVIAPDGRSGQIRLGGGIEYLQLGAGQVFWHEPWLEPAATTTLVEVDVEPTPTFPGKLGQISIAGIDLAPATINSDPKARTVSVGGAALTLSPQTAETFNEAFAKPQGKADVFRAGESLGTISFTAQTQ